jgi:CubicO group peptidase (beta-lactamase class C family)
MNERSASTMTTAAQAAQQPRRLDETRIAERILAAMDARGTPGVALAVVRDDAVVHAAGFGVTSVEDGGAPATERTLFQIGSVTKPLTGTLVMRLVEQGLLDLDRPVRAWLPGMTLSGPGAADVITLRMLLSHTSGLPWDQISPTRVFGRRDPGALADWVRDELPERPFVAPPGTRWSYSNPGINLAARVAEVATGQWYAELMQEQVFEPLGMQRTTLDPTVAMTYPLAQSHARDADGTLRVEHRMADNVAQYPSAFAFSSALDLARFARMQLNGGEIDGHRVLAAESVAEMQRPQADRREGDATHYGLTLSINGWRGVQRIGHTGGIRNYGCELAFVPDSGVAVVLLYNHGAFAEVAVDIANEILAALLSS